MNIFNLNPQQQDVLIEELSKHVTESRWKLIEKVIENRTQYVTLVLEDIYQPHNAAAAIRSCDGFGIQDIHVIENRNKLILKNTSVTKGADKWMNFFYYNDPQANNTEVCIQSLKQKGYRIAATALGKQSLTLEQIPLDKPLAVMIGTEKDGLTEAACNLADCFIELPMYGFTQSYNLSVCAALTLYSLTNRLRSSEIDWRLSPESRRRVLLTWLQRCINHCNEISEDFLKKVKL